MSAKVYDGATFVAGVPKVWDGAAWVPGFMKTWDGADWIPDAPPPGGLLFEDDFNRPDGPDWGPKWTFDQTASRGIERIISSRGEHGVTSGSGSDFYSQAYAVGSTHTLVEIYLAMEPASPTSGSAWEYFMWRSTGDIGGSAGRPTTAWYLRRDIQTGTNVYILYRRISNAEVSVANLGEIGTNNASQEVRIRMDADDHIQIKVWDEGSAEPGAWSLDYTEVGAVITDPGIVQLGTRKRESTGEDVSRYNFITVEAI